jgi:ribosomal-protein-alanine N-acetyltransferase
MPYILDNMTQEDIPQVATIERLCFSMPWPTSAYRRELKTPETNRYIVCRFVPPVIASTLQMPETTAENLTSLAHPELQSQNGHDPAPVVEQPGRSFLSMLLPWLRNNGASQATSPPRAHSFPVVGYAGLWLMVDEAHVTTIGVHPDHRGQGAGELLFLGLVDIAHQMRAVRITLEVRVSNKGAQAMYRKFGLEVAGVRKRYYSDNGEDAYIMWSQPIASPQFRDKVEVIRAQLAERLQHGFYQLQQPSREVDRTRLQ